MIPPLTQRVADGGISFAHMPLGMTITGISA
jgi:hypothetical protein